MLLYFNSRGGSFKMKFLKIFIITTAILVYGQAVYDWQRPAIKAWSDRELSGIRQSVYVMRMIVAKGLG